MDVKLKRQWSVEETNCLLALWSSAEVQNKVDGTSRTKLLFKQIQREMATAGYNRNIEQINNKLKKLKKEYRDQKKELGRSSSGRSRRNPHFDFLDSLIGDRPACRLQQWSEEETNCLLALWSSAEVQNKLDGASRKKPVLEEIQREMATVGYNRNIEQIKNKLKKLKKEYRDQKKELGRSSSGRSRRNPHFELLDSVLGDTPPACQLTEALNSAPAMLEVTLDDTLSQNSTDTTSSLPNLRKKDNQSFSMDVKLKRQWSVEETNCLLSLWSSTEVQNKVDGTSRTKLLFKQIQREMATAGYNRNIEQINNKLKKLKKEYRDQKKELGRSSSGRSRRNPHFDFLDSVLGDRPACRLQQWSEEETNCLLALWTSAEVQNKLDGASRKKPVLEEIQREMATVGYNRNIEQIKNKLKKLKKEYRDQKKELGRSSSGRSRRNPHFELLDSVLGDTPPACQLTEALNSAPAMLEVTVDDTLSQNSTDPELSAIDDVDADEELLPPLDCSSPTPSCSSGAQSSASSSQQARRGKRKRDNTAELLKYLERADERFLQHSKDMNDSLLQKIEANTAALLRLMERLVEAMEAQSHK